MCNFEVPDFPAADPQNSPTIEFIPDPYNEAKYSVKLTGINTQDQYTVLAIGSLFPDRWQIVGSASGEATYDDQLDQWEYHGEFSTDTLPITAYFAFIGQHGSSYYYFNAPFDAITRSLSTPDVSASYNSTSGYSLSWYALDGAHVRSAYRFPIANSPLRHAA